MQMSYIPQPTSTPARFRISGGLLTETMYGTEDVLTGSSIVARQVKASISSVSFVDPQMVALIEHLNDCSHKDVLLELEIAEDGTIVGRVVGP